MALGPTLSYVLLSGASHHSFLQYLISLENALHGRTWPIKASHGHYNTRLMRRDLAVIWRPPNRIPRMGVIGGNPATRQQ